MESLFPDSASGKSQWIGTIPVQVSDSDPRLNAPQDPAPTSQEWHWIPFPFRQHWKLLLTSRLEYCDADDVLPRYFAAHPKQHFCLILQEFRLRERTGPPSSTSIVQSGLAFPSPSSSSALLRFTLLPPDTSHSISHGAKVRSPGLRQDLYRPRRGLPLPSRPANLP
jgi:hypothetical protein